MGSTRIDRAAPVGADLAGATEDGVLAEVIRTVAGLLALGLRSFRKGVLV
jgi:hypothetical protein